jgi:protein phosphatase
MEENLKHLGMGTTVVTAWLRETHAIIGHVGDSRAYLVRSGEIRQLTTDHTLVNEQVRRGILSDSEARNHPSRNILTRAVGSHGQVMVDITEEKLEPGDFLLLCSDGLYTMIDDPAILQIVTRNAAEPDKACQSLIGAANDRGGEDNITVILLKVEST